LFIGHTSLPSCSRNRTSRISSRSTRGPLLYGLVNDPVDTGEPDDSASIFELPAPAVIAEEQ